MDEAAKAAMLLSFDIEPAAQAEHDDWHSHEHLPERLAIPGFLRGSRWRSLAGGPAYFVLYEVSELAVLSSPAYLQRLNQPSAWTTKMMPSYRGMTRGLCEIVARAGHGLGGSGLLLRFAADAADLGSLRDWLTGTLIPALPAQKGMASALLLRSGLAAELTTEQRIRGQDATVDWALLATGYDASSMQALAAGALSPEALRQRGASGVVSGTYQLVHSVDRRDIARSAD